MKPDIYLSHSALSVFRDCRKKFYFKYIKNRTPIKDDDSKLSFGRLWDDVSGIVWEAGKNAAYEYLEENAGVIDSIEMAKCLALLANYNPPLEQYEFMGNQIRLTFRPKGVYNTFLVAIADTVLQDEKGQLVIRECKTTSNDIEGFGSYWQRIQIDTQVEVYGIAYDAAYILYDVTRRPMYRPSAADRKAAGSEDEHEIALAYQHRVQKIIEENPQKFFQIRKVWKTTQDVEEAKAEIRDQCRVVKNSIRTGMWFKNSGHCINRYGTCPYIDVCAGRANIDDDSLFTAYRK